MKILTTAFTAVFTLFSFSSAGQVSWHVDPTHGHMGFSIQYMMLGDYGGDFKFFEGKVSSKSETDFTGAVLYMVIDLNTVSCQVEGHEQILKSEDFFDAAKYPFATFKSTGVKARSEKGQYDVEGDFTMKNITKKIKLLAVAASKPVTNPYSNTTNYGLKISGSIKRSDFEIGTYDMLDGGGLVLGEEVNFYCTLVLQKSDQIIPMVHSHTTAIEGKELSKYTGQYDFGDNILVNVTAEAGKLFVKTTNGTKKEIFHFTENKFIYEFREIELDFIKDKTGKVTSFIQSMAGGVFKKEAKKISDQPLPEQKEEPIKDPYEEPDYNKECWAALTTKNYSLAIDRGIKGLKEDPGNVHIKTNLAHAYLFSGNQAKAIKLYKENLGKESSPGMPHSREIQEDFTFFKSRKFPTDIIDKAFKDLNLVPNETYAAMK